MSGLFDDVLQAPSAAPTRTISRPGLFDDVLNPVRATAAATIGVPLAAHRLVQSELLRLGRAASQVPTFQRYAEPLGDIARRPLEFARLPTEATAGVAPGTPINPIARYTERQAQNALAAGFGDLLAQELSIGALGSGLWLGSRVAQALRNRLVTSGRIAPEVIPAGRPLPPRRPVTPQAATPETPPTLALPAPRLPSTAELSNRIGTLDDAIAQAHQQGMAPGTPVFRQLLAEREALRQEFIQRPVVEGVASQAETPLAIRLPTETPRIQSGFSRPIGTPTYPQVPTAATVAKPVKPGTPPGRISQPLVRVRQQAIQAVARELREQSVILNQERLGLRKRVLEVGGIKPTLAGGMWEELQAIRPFLRQGGRAIDDVATELGFEDGEALRKALIAGQGARMPKLAELQRQAVQIVDSTSGGRILEALQAKGATSKAITAVVKDVTQQTQAELRAGQQQVRGILTEAQRKAMTPAQLARFARMQRAEPGATTLGPRGATREAPLTPADIRRVEATTAQVVPRNITEAQRARLEQGMPTRLPGGPNQPPPILPTSRALVPSGFRAQRDVPVSFTRATSEVDIQRAAQFVDGKMLGPVNQRVVQPVIQADVRAVAKAEAIRKEFRRFVQGIKLDSLQDAKLLRATENQLEPGETLTSSDQALVDRWVAFRQQALEEINQALVRVGKKPLTGRQDYAPHLPTLTFLGDLFGDLTHVPDEVLQSIPLLKSIFETPIGQRDPNLQIGRASCRERV